MKSSRQPYKNPVREHPVVVALVILTVIEVSAIAVWGWTAVGVSLAAIIVGLIYVAYVWNYA